MSELKSLIEEYDESDYLSLLEQFPDQVIDGTEKGRSVELPSEEYENILVCGMGGSGIAGDLLSQFLFYRSSVPIQTNRFYRVPAWVDDNTLVIVVSYSGNTEETLSACDDAIRCDADCLAVTSNGDLKDRVQSDDLAHVQVPEDLPPRAAAAYLFLPLPYALSDVGGFDVPEEGIVDRACNELHDISSELSPKHSENDAVLTARKLSGKIPIVYGSEEVTAVLGKRFKNQINENAKRFAVFNVIPEMNHNEIMALDHLEEAPQRYGVVFLRDQGEHGRVQKRFEILHDLLDDSVGYVGEIESSGRALLTRFLTLMLRTDYVSYYMALFNEKDPTSIGYINELKQRL
jgi:glucose/mannose-6-phosphate isomerase